MSTDYSLYCEKHKHIVGVCSDGYSGPMNQCGWELAGFIITHRNCALRVVDEHKEDACEDVFKEYKEWDNANWKDLLNYRE